MDPETGFDAVRNVGVRGGEIAAVSEDPLSGEIVLDVAGLVVAPGFIDLHAHGQSNRANEFQARDGVTTALELESGVALPAVYLARRARGAILNYGAAVSHMSVRTRAMPARADAVRQALAFAEDDPGRALRELASVGSAARYEPRPARRLRRAARSAVEWPRRRRPRNRDGAPVLPGRHPRGDSRGLQVRRRGEHHHPHPRARDEYRRDAGGARQRRGDRGAASHRARQQLEPVAHRAGARPDRRHTEPWLRRHHRGLPLHGRLDRSPVGPLRPRLAGEPADRLRRPAAAGHRRAPHGRDLRELPGRRRHGHHPHDEGRVDPRGALNATS